MVFYKRKGLPSKGDIVICRIKKILTHSAFAQLIEFDNLEGMIHISEVSSKWIKNIQDFLTVDEQVVCRVENVDEQKGYIDLSIKRVSTGEEKKKKNEFKMENRIEKLVEHACKQTNMNLEEFYKKEGFSLVEKYGSLQVFYEAFMEDNSIIDKLNFSKQFRDHLKEAFNSLLQKTRVSVNKRVKFLAFGPVGLDNIKSFIADVMKKTKEESNSFQIKYIDAPEYLLTIDSRDYKESDAYFERIIDVMKGAATKYDIKIL